MADRKITELTALAAGSQATGDLLAIVDVSETAAASKNKKITVETLFKGIPSNVGIGTASPARDLHVHGSDSDTVQIHLTNSTTGATSNDGFSVVLGSDESAILNMRENNPMRFFTNDSERMRIDNSGNVGIGTTSAGAVVSGMPTLHLASATAGRSGAIRWKNTGETNKAAAYWFGTEFQIGTETSHPLKFTTADTERMRIDSSGNVGIGTTSPAALCHINKTSGTTLYRASVAGNSTIGLEIVKTGSTTQSWRIVDGQTVNGKLEFYDVTDSATRMCIDGSGNIGIGTTLPSRLLTVQSTGNANLCIKSGTSGVSQCMFGDTDSDVAGNIAYRHSDNAMAFEVNGSERIRIDSSGNLGIGTSSPSRDFHNASGVCLTTGAAPQYRLNGGAGDSNDNDRAIFGLATGNNHFFSGAVAGDTYLRSTNGGNLVFGQGTNERMRIATEHVLVGRATDGDTPGLTFRYDGFLRCNRAGNTVAVFNRRTNDGVIIQFRQGDTQEGTISVSGSTVTYGGGHLARWSQLEGGAERTEILRGSVLSNLDEMCEWGEEDNEQLNRTKVSDVEGDANVAGVFVRWDDDDDTYTNDFYCAMTGDFVIRIAQGTTVARGDLLMSAGDGTAKPQDDDIVRSKTIAKVTSTTVSTTYADGSYCVPCVLMAC